MVHTRHAFDQCIQIRFVCLASEVPTCAIETAGKRMQKSGDLLLCRLLDRTRSFERHQSDLYLHVDANVEWANHRHPRRRYAARLEIVLHPRKQFETWNGFGVARAGYDDYAHLTA